jgi:hypothetical protein
MNGPQRPVLVVIDEFHAKTWTPEDIERKLSPQLVASALQVRQFSANSLFSHRVDAKVPALYLDRGLSESET